VTGEAAGSSVESAGEIFSIDPATPIFEGGRPVSKHAAVWSRTAAFQKTGDLGSGESAAVLAARG
jgi:hypothetical protein